MATTFENKVAILGSIWMDYRDDVEFADFIEYNDLGLPLAYAITGGIVQSTPQAEKFVNETFDLLLAGLSIEEDTGFEDIEDLLG
jgi:hypothetical protein